MTAKKRRILFIGPSPNNIGGVSIHLKRLIYLLKDDYIIDFIDEGRIRQNEIYNVRSLNPFPYFKKIVQSHLVHIHSGIPILRMFHIVICRLLLRKKTIVTIHRDITIERHVKTTRWFLRRCSHVITVNQRSYDFISEGMKFEKCSIIPAFLPPISEQEPELPQEVSNWINVRKTHDSILIISNAGNLVMKNGEDLYGVDLCIEAMQHLVNQLGETKFFFIFVIATCDREQLRLEKYKQLVASYGLTNHFLIWDNGLSFIKLIEHAQLVLRTTNTDGDALTVREALHMGRNVIASDVVERPQGTILFKNRDVKDLVKKIMKFKSRICDYNTGSNSEDDYKIIYRKIYS